MYHGIIQKGISGILLQEGMYVNPDTFHKQIKYLTENFTIVSLEVCLHIIKQNTYGKKTRLSQR